MGCETCILQCPAILEAQKRVAVIDEQLPAITQREHFREADAAAWQAEVETAIDRGTWTKQIAARHDGFRAFVATANQDDQDRRERAVATRMQLGAKMRKRVEGCSNGPRDGWFGLGIVGATVCRSRVQDDGLPNKANRA